jgi:NADH-quinone oxidoreductase subunit L
VGAEALGAGFAWFEFGRPGAPQIGFAERIPIVRELFAERWYLDHAFRKFVDVVIDRVSSNLCARSEDRVLNRGIDGLCRFTLSVGRFFSRLQSGKLRYDFAVMFGALLLIALYFSVT